MDDNNDIATFIRIITDFKTVSYPPIHNFTNKYNKKNPAFV